MLKRVDSSESGLQPWTVSVQTKTDAFSFLCGSGETLLAAGLSAGFDLPYECATGTCGTCRARVSTGEVDPGWANAPAYSKLHRDKGDILLCQAHPLGDCALRVPIKTPQPTTLAVRDLDYSGRVDVVRQLTRDVILFEVALSAPVDFHAGQFVALKHPDLVGRRAYSMVNFGRRLERLVFVLKRKLDGGFSQLAFEGDLLGSEIEILGPLGRATFHPEEGRDVLCIAGGSGIAGMMAILRHASEIRYFDSHKGHVFFGVRTMADAFFLDHFAEHLAAAVHGLEITIAMSDETDLPAFHPECERVHLAVGMVHDVAARTLATPWPNAIGFVAGPQPMVDAALRVLLTRAGLGPDRIRFDKFS